MPLGELFPLLSEEGVVSKFQQKLLVIDHHHYWLRAIALAFAPLIPVCAS